MQQNITPTWPPDGLITILTEGHLIELELDNRDDIVRVQLDADRAALLIAALQMALSVVKGKEGV